MEEALGESRALNPKNPLAAQCWLDYLLGQNGPKMVPGNYKESYRPTLEQIAEAFDVLFDLDTGFLSENERNRYRQKRKVCLMQLAQGENHGYKWEEKLERLYGE